MCGALNEMKIAHVVASNRRAVAVTSHSVRYALGLQLHKTETELSGSKKRQIQP